MTRHLLAARVLLAALPGCQCRDGAALVERCFELREQASQQPEATLSAAAQTGDRFLQDCALDGIKPDHAMTDAVRARLVDQWRSDPRSYRASHAAALVQQGCRTGQEAGHAVPEAGEPVDVGHRYADGVEVPVLEDGYPGRRPSGHALAAASGRSCGEARSGCAG